MIAIFSTTPLSWFFPPTTLERTRIHAYLHGFRNVLVGAVFWWYDSWIEGLALGTFLFLLDYLLNHQRLSIFRKLAAGQTFSPLPGEPQLSHLDAMRLNMLRKGDSTAENISVTLLFLMLAGMVIWMPATFAPLATWTVAGYLTRRSLSIYTEKRSHWLRIARWTTMAVAAVLPPLYGTRAPWLGAILLAWFFVLLDLPGIRLRRKLPVEQWPQRLYW
jgi:hypothetical protein